MMTPVSDSRMVLFGDGESKLSLLCCDDEPEEAAALHLMPNIQVCNVCIELGFLNLSLIDYTKYTIFSVKKMFKHVVFT